MRDEHVYQRPLPLFWWLERRSYLLFVLRELSSVFVAWFVVYLLLLVNAVSDGAASYQEFLDRSGHWWVVAINVIAMLFVLLHAVTWFGLAPQGDGGQGARAPPAAAAGRRRALPGLVGAVGDRRLGGPAMNRRRPLPEPLLWMLFSSGGMVAALMIPVLLFLFGIAFPLDWLTPPDHAHLFAVLRNPITRLVLFGAVRAGAVPLGPPLPLHPVRRPAAEAVRRTDRGAVLRRRRSRIRHRRRAPAVRLRRLT